MNPLFDLKKEGDCQKCRLHTNCESPRMKYTGHGNKRILIIGEAPSRNEDIMGEQFVGDSGTLLRQTLDSLGLDLDNDCWKTNVLKCRSSKAPTASQIKCCLPFLENELEELHPRKIFLLGVTALQALMQTRVPKVGGVADWLGMKIPDEKTQAWIYPMYHPSFIIWSEGKGRYGTIFQEIMEQAVQHDAPFPEYSKRNYNIFKLNEKEATEYLPSLSTCLISIDYETTGIKPQAEGHKIISMSISPDACNAYVFPVTRSLYMPIRRVLNDKSIQKSAQNLKFERMWSKVIFGTTGTRWAWDSLIGTHLLNNQTQTGLKFQTYATFGIADYSKEVDKFLKAENANGFNKIEQANLSKLLEYNAMDTIFEHRLSIIQKQQMTPALMQAYTLIHNSLMALSDTEIQGLCVDTKHYKEHENRLLKRVQEITTEIMQAKEGKAWRKKYGDKFSLGSSNQLRDILFKEFGYKAENFTDNGNESVDKKTLEDLNTPFLQKLLQLRQTLKLKDTYIAQITRETVDNRIHPIIGFAPVSWRSSVRNPSFQNIPSRVPETVEAIKGGIIPRQGCRFLDSDYGSIEVRVSAMYHKDPVMIDYLWNPDKGDMHKDTAMDCYILTEDEMSKDARKCAKNSYVFPQFYGDYYVNCARNLWENIGAYQLSTKDKQVCLYEHLKQHGIRNYTDFESHIQRVEDFFWNERFKVYNQWKKDTWELYLKQGFLESLFGFRFTGAMDRNNALNYQIQSTAFHLMLWAYTKISNWLKQNKFHTKLVGETHDSMLADVAPEEFDQMIQVTKQIMVTDLIKQFSFINVPIEIEIEATEINQSWYYKQVIDAYKEEP